MLAIAQQIVITNEIHHPDMTITKSLVTIAVKKHYIAVNTTINIPTFTLFFITKSNYQVHIQFLQVWLVHKMYIQHRHILKFLY